MNSFQKELMALESPILLAGNERIAYRDPCVFRRNGTFHLFFTLVETETDGSVFLYVATTETRDFRLFSPIRKITVRDQRCNYSSPGNVLEFGGLYHLCFQSYCRENGEKFGNERCRLFRSSSPDLRCWSPPEIIPVKGPDVQENQMGRMIDPFWFFDRKDPGKIWCFFKQNGISYAWSRDLKKWNFIGRMDGGENVCVVIADSRYHLWSSPKNGISLQTSRDLEHWEPEGRLITLGQNQWEWARGRLTAGFVLDLRDHPDVGLALLFYHGTGPEDESVVFDTHACIGIAWSNDLLHWHYPGEVRRTESCILPSCPAADFGNTDSNISLADSCGEKALKCRDIRRLSHPSSGEFRRLASPSLLKESSEREKNGKPEFPENTNKKQRNEKMSSRKFTLIELLIVIVVIVILIAMLFPALNKARQTAVKVKCAGNLKQIGTALVVYAGDQEFFPPAKQAGYNLFNLNTWHWLLMPYLEMKRKAPGDWLSASRIRESGVLLCPALNFNPSMRDRNSYSMFGFGPLAAWYKLSPNKVVYGAAGDANAIYAASPSSSCSFDGGTGILPRPSIITLVSEAGYVSGTDGNDVVFQNCKQLGNEPLYIYDAANGSSGFEMAYRHVQRKNVLWLDAHVSDVGLNQLHSHGFRKW